MSTMTMTVKTLVHFAATMLAGFVVSACTVTGPNVLVLPGRGSTFEQFQGDDTACRQIARGQDGETSQSRYDMTYVQCMYAKGHQVPMVGAPPSGTSSTSQPAKPRPADVPPPPQGTPPPPPPGPAR
jgi:hypothetical protein